MKTFFRYKYSILIIALALAWTGEALWVIHSWTPPQLGAVKEYRLYPNSKLTPGVIRTTNAKEICTHSTKEIRHTTDAMKREAAKRYGISYPSKKGTIEYDHYEALGIGGADSVDNLWPQPAPEFHWKDAVELYLHNQICAGKITPKEAQEKITHWVDTYQELKNKLGGIYPDEEYE